MNVFSILQRCWCNILDTGDKPFQTWHIEHFNLFAICCYTIVDFSFFIQPHFGCLLAQGLKFVPFSKPLINFVTVERWSANKIIAFSWPDIFTCNGTWQFLAFCCKFCICEYVRFIRDVLNLLTCMFSPLLESIMAWNVQ